MGWFARRAARSRNRRRAIFRYWDGERDRGIDPAVAYRALWSHPRYDPATHPGLVEIGNVKATDIMLGAIRDVFDLKCWSEDSVGEHGLTDNEAVVLLIDFNEYMESLKKSGNPTPTSRPPTGPEYSETESTITSVRSDSGSISGGSRIVEPSTA